MIKRPSIGHLCWNVPSQGQIATDFKRADKHLRSAVLRETRRVVATVSSSSIGSSNAGDTCRRVLWEPHCREIILREINYPYRELLRPILEHIAVVLRVINSDQKVRILAFRRLCVNLYGAILTEFPWVMISPTVHKTIAHAWELMALNGFRGLLRLSESGIESLNKTFLFVQSRLAGNFSEEGNLIDSIRRLWIMSSPLRTSLTDKAKPFCKVCKIHGHSKRQHNKPVGDQNTDDMLVNSFFGDEGLTLVDLMSKFR